MTDETKRTRGHDLLEAYMARTKSSQAAIGAVCGVSGAAVCRWFTMNRVPGTEEVLRIEEWTGGEVPVRSWRREAP